MLRSHDCISGCSLCFALCITRQNSLLKEVIQFNIDGSSTLKIYLFLFFWIHQFMVMIISMAKGTPRAFCCILWLSLVLAKLVPVYQFATSRFLQRNISRSGTVPRVSSLCNIHISHVQESKCIYILSSQ
jgi:hypothetical protein